MTDRLSKRTQANLVSKLTAVYVAVVVLDSWVVPCSAPDIIFTNNGKQFTSMFLAALCAFSGTKVVMSINISISSAVWWGKFGDYSSTDCMVATLY